MLNASLLGVALRGLIFLALILGSVADAKANPIGIGFGAVGVLGLGGPTTVILSGGTVTGGVGVAPNGGFTLSGGSISGDLYLDQGGALINSGTIGGSILQNAATDTLLSSWALAAFNLSATDAALGSTILTPTSINISGVSQTITGGPGVNVLNLTGFILSGGDLILSAPAGGSFVLNDSGAFVLSGAQILLDGGLGSGDVVFNLTQAGAASISGSSMSGVVLGTSRVFSISNSCISGQVLGGGSVIGVGAGSTVSAGAGACGSSDPDPAPEPESASVVLLGMVMIALMGLYRRRRIAKS